MSNNTTGKHPETVSRRGFLAAATVAATSVAADSAFGQNCPATGPGYPAAGGAFVEVGEVASTGKVLSATLAVDDAPKSYWTGTSCSSNQQMRYFESLSHDGGKLWPKSSNVGLPAPGPTLRARMGDKIQITLLNHVNPKNFPKTLDQAESGNSKGCDVSTTLVADGNGGMKRVEVYPGEDKEPDCFHGSSTANLHFHGFHVSPSIIADNVLVQVRPSPRDPAGRPVVTERTFQADFQYIFDGHNPKKWADLPRHYRDEQTVLLRQYDKEHPNAGLLVANEKAIAQGEWPQYYVGAYPYNFKITEVGVPPAPGMPPAVMGQAPGTHWYHAHKHGSTALNSFNGMSGVFIVEGEFDDKLNAYYAPAGSTNYKLPEKVLVLQQFSSTMNLMSPSSATGGPPAVCVNGVPKPVLTMLPGETQRWRILNACSQAAVSIAIAAVGSAAPISWRQIAQDGVQLAYPNYDKANPTPTLAPGNRVDLLVQAPTAIGTYTVSSGGTTLFTLKVEGTGVQPKTFPDSSTYPAMPDFLKDLDQSKIHVRRDITFNTAPLQGRPRSTTTGLPPVHTIDGKLFENNTIDQIMALDSIEEWTLYNVASGPKHPFHIHVNPFQVVEVFDPSLTEQNVIKAPYVWWDVIAIPAAKNGKPGYVKIRSRFADFVGLFVLHCHILAHEDRGMMQLVEVVSNKALQEHYH
jgi:FtsP/CotA-like multicopper oxidase with cupredoxin domain